ncbi:4838_t:CDS:2 [Funneliformis geosporum]|uniref:Histone H1 n=1 Tax=Funneliformis geosporum TaxID=1117311 RepID=A0A9W4T2A4_9GLOM|nr:4838_t:CDS:2 [Funneliformis geosporum]
MTSQPTSQVSNLNNKTNFSATTSSRQQVSNSRGNPQLQEEWCDEDGEFELEEDDINQTEQSIDVKQGSSGSIAHNVDDNEGDNTFSNQKQSLIDYNNSHKADDAKSLNNQVSLSPSPLSQNADANENDNFQKTKYGRKVQRPVLFTPETKKSQSDTKKRSSTNKSSGKRPRRLSSVSHNLTSPNSQQCTPQSVSSPKLSQNVSHNNLPEVKINIEQELDQAVADDVVCILCHDGSSPKLNRIVLCDKCDTPYHQQCHKPSVEDRVVEISDAEWICSKCDDLRERKRRKVDVTSVIGLNPSVSSRYSREISGDGLTEEQKIAYLSSLPQRVLIDLILIAEKLHPDLPLYPADVKEKVANNAYSMSDRSRSTSNDPRVLAISTSLPHQSFMSQISIPQQQLQQSSLQPLQNYQPSSINNNNLSRAHLPAVGIDLPSYEEMIVQALASIANPDGSAPRNIFDWMNSTYPLHKNFRASASQALQKAVKKGRVYRIGTVYKNNPTYRPAKTDSHNGQDGIYEIAVRLGDNENFPSVHDMEERNPSLTSSALSSPPPNAISNGHTTVTSPEAHSPLDEMPNKVVSVMINEPSSSLGSIISNQSIISPIIGRIASLSSTINNQPDLPSTLLPPPVQPTLPSLSSVGPYFGYGGNKQNPMYSTFSFTPPPTGGYNTGLPSLHSTSLSRDHEKVQGSGTSSSPTGATHLQ